LRRGFSFNRIENGENAEKKNIRTGEPILIKIISLFK